MGFLSALLGSGGGAAAGGAASGAATGAAGAATSAAPSFGSSLLSGMGGGNVGAGGFGNSLGGMLNQGVRGSQQQLPPMMSVPVTQTPAMGASDMTDPQNNPNQSANLLWMLRNSQ